MRWPGQVAFSDLARTEGGPATFGCGHKAAARNIRASRKRPTNLQAREKSVVVFAKSTGGLLILLVGVFGGLLLGHFSGRWRLLGRGLRPSHRHRLRLGFGRLRHICLQHRLGRMLDL